VLLQDTLTPLHQYVEAVLGPGHPVSAELGQLAAANESPAVRQARLEKQRVMEVSGRRTCAGLCSANGSLRCWCASAHRDACACTAKRGRPSDGTFHRPI